MKTKVFKKMVFITITIFLGVSQNALSQQNNNGYRDEKGRIVETDGSLTKITYQNGSYFHENSPLPGVRDKMWTKWKVIYPNGEKLLYESGNGFVGFSIDSVVYINLENADSQEKFEKYANLGSLPKAHLDKYTERIWIRGGDLSSVEIRDYIENALSKWIDNPEQLKEVYDVDKKEFRGKMENGKYISQDLVDKRNSIKEKEATKKHLAELAPYTKRFGFNPEGKPLKQLIKVGRSFKLLKDWNYGYLQDHNQAFVKFNLSIDHGSSKNYDMIWYDHLLTNKLGYIWVTGDKITSVVWY